MSVESHRERLRVPLWWWPACLGLGAVLAAEVHLGHRGLRSWLPYALVLPAVAALLWWLGRIRIRVADGEVLVDDARLPLRYIAGAVPVVEAAKRAALGPQLSPLAFVIHRPWLSGVVKVTLADPADPTPYWIVSSRRPAELAAAINCGDRNSARQPGGTG